MSQYANRYRALVHVLIALVLLVCWRLSLPRHALAAAALLVGSQAKLASADAAEVADGAIELAGGETRTLTLVPAAGEYKLVCTHTGHAVLGMTGRIAVR